MSEVECICDHSIKLHYYDKYGCERCNCVEAKEKPNLMILTKEQLAWECEHTKNLYTVEILKLSMYDISIIKEGMKDYELIKETKYELIYKLWVTWNEYLAMSSKMHDKTGGLTLRGHPHR